MDDDERVHAEQVEDWRSWLVEHHDSRTGVWLVSWKSHTGRRRIDYEDAVLEALTVGWIDSVQRTLDDDRTMQRYTPRRPGSAWSKPNKDRVALLEAEGRMLPAGQRMVEQAKTSGMWSLYDGVDNLVVPDDLAAAFEEHPGSREEWDRFPPGARRAMLAWIVQAKRPETRTKRIGETAEKAARGQRAIQ